MRVYVASEEHFAPIVKGDPSLLLYCSGDESRTLPEYDFDLPTTVRTAAVIAQSDNVFSLEGDVVAKNLLVANPDAIYAAVAGFRQIALDITGIPTPIWARFVQLFRAYITILYTAPKGYTKSKIDDDDFHDDLTETVYGLASLPGFKRSLLLEDKKRVLIPLLGFEGARFALIAKQYEEYAEDVVPIVGVPGYRLHYPFLTYLANKRVLLSTRSWERVKFAAAFDPFETKALIEKIITAGRFESAVVAPIGTKPQALGAVLAAIDQPETVELVYDFPVRKHGRTKGRRMTWVYPINSAGQTSA